MFRVRCRDHGELMGEVMDTSLGAFFRSRWPLSGRESWGDRLQEERELQGGRRARPIRVTVLASIEPIDWPTDVLPPRWLGAAAHGWCSKCERRRIISQDLLLAGVDHYRAGNGRDLLT